jgi:hypothetical protein
MAEPKQPFDPVAILSALDRHRVNYILVGTFAGVLRGTDEIADGIELVPSTRPENLRRLESALASMDAQAADGQDPTLKAERTAEFASALGEITVTPLPPGTAGYDDLRRAATREPLGSGLRPAVASTGDLARTVAAQGRDEDVPRLLALRRIAELERQLGVEL